MKWKRQFDLQVDFKFDRKWTHTTLPIIVLDDLDELFFFKNQTFVFLSRSNMHLVSVRKSRRSTKVKRNVTPEEFYAAWRSTPAQFRALKERVYEHSEYVRGGNVFRVGSMQRLLAFLCLRRECFVASGMIRNQRRQLNSFFTQVSKKKVPAGSRKYSFVQTLLTRLQLHEKFRGELWFDTDVDLVRTLNRLRVELEEVASESYDAFAHNKIELKVDLSGLTVESALDIDDTLDSGESLVCELQELLRRENKSTSEHLDVDSFVNIGIAHKLLRRRMPSA